MVSAWKLAQYDGGIPGKAISMASRMLRRLGLPAHQTPQTYGINREFTQE